MGSDFTAVEQRLVRALGWLKSATATRGGKLRTIASALVYGGAADPAALERMGLASPTGVGEKLTARLMALALSRTARL